VHAGTELNDQTLVLSGVLPWFAIDRDARITGLHAKRERAEVRRRWLLLIGIKIRVSVPISRSDGRLTLG
jgi:hypothetical protein